MDLPILEFVSINIIWTPINKIEMAESKCVNRSLSLKPI